MSVTAKEIWYSAYRQSGLVRLEQSGLGEDEEEEARQTYNGMVDSWAADGLTVGHISRDLFNITASQATYTIGPAGNWNVTPRPARIERASIVLTGYTPNPEYQIFPLTVDEWQQWVLKGQATNWPQRFFYEKSPTLGKVHLLYVPNDANQIALYLEHPVSQIAAAADYAAVVLEFEPGYQEALEFNLARRLYLRNQARSTLDMEARAELKESARASLRLIEQVNNRPLMRRNDMVSGRRRSNVYAGSRYSL